MKEDAEDIFAPKSKPQQLIAETRKDSDLDMFVKN